MELLVVTNNSLEFAQAIADYGILVVIAAFFLCMVGMMIAMQKKMQQNISSEYKLLLDVVIEKNNDASVVESIEKMQNSITQSLTRLHASMGGMSNSIDKMSEVILKLGTQGEESARQESTPGQIKALLNNMYTAIVASAVVSVDEIITVNHIENKTRTKVKIHNVAQNIFNKAKADMAEFKWRSERISRISLDDQRDLLIKIIEDYIYSDKPRNQRKFVSDLDILKTAFYNDTISEIF